MHFIFSRQFGPDWSYFILINKPADICCETAYYRGGATCVVTWRVALGLGQLSRDASVFCLSVHFSS